MDEEDGPRPEPSLAGVDFDGLLREFGGQIVPGSVQPRAA